MPRVFLRIELEPRGRIGPGKIALLEAIADTGSISAAGRRLKMSYRRAWTLAEELNGLFTEPVVTTQMGGSHGGGSVVTPFGRRVIASYRALESEAQSLARERLAPLEAAVSPEPARGRS